MSECKHEDWRNESRYRCVTCGEELNHNAHPAPADKVEKCVCLNMVPNSPHTAKSCPFNDTKPTPQSAPEGQKCPWKAPFRVEELTYLMDADNNEIMSNDTNKVNYLCDLLNGQQSLRAELLDMKARLDGSNAERHLLFDRLEAVKAGTYKHFEYAEGFADAKLLYEAEIQKIKNKVKGCLSFEAGIKLEADLAKQKERWEKLKEDMKSKSSYLQTVETADALSREQQLDALLEIMRNLEA